MQAGMEFVKKAVHEFRYKKEAAQGFSLRRPSSWGSIKEHGFALNMNDLGPIFVHVVKFGHIHAFDAARTVVGGHMRVAAFTQRDHATGNPPSS